MEKEIRQKWFFTSSPQRVWEFLTKPELLAEWLMENDFKPEVGHQFRFRAKPGVRVGFDGNIYCQVLEIVPFKKLSYTWKGGPGNGKIALDSVVTWTLAEKSGGTEVLLVHSGFRGMRNYITYLIMNKGWTLILRKRLTRQIHLHENESANC